MDHDMVINIVVVVVVIINQYNLHSKYSDL